MGIRAKIISIVLPLLIVALLLGGLSASYVATNAVTRVAVEFLEFKTDELEKYVDGQWTILVENGLSGRDDMVQAAQAGIEVFARSIVRSDSEVIFALDETGALALSTDGLELREGESDALLRVTGLGDRALQTSAVAGAERVYTAFAFEPFGWSFFVSELRDAFYSDVDRIIVQTIYLVAIGSVLAVALVFLFVRYLTAPLRRVVGSMREIIATSDLSSRVSVDFNDEIGELSHTFNVMTGELEKAQTQIKRHAYEAVLSQKREQRIRQIFQKYVPQEIIDRFFQNPESMLVGENREIAVLFSDIRSFTTISEAMKPDRLVHALNRYFSTMVDRILDRGGVIDKYIGDAIMALFGAPVRHENDAAQAVLAGLDMIEAVGPFNARQEELGEHPFLIGVGIDYGEVTVGNIGTERKMDYTVIGDRVNVASRLEGLTKKYGQPLLFSEALAEAAAEHVPVRRVAKVA
ncbi:MAG: adenylate/guanylate cyclase domain-containing protein, partial [Spirochaetota bacterium]